MKRLKVQAFVLITFLLLGITENVNAGVKSVFFDLFHKTDYKINYLRSEFDIQSYLISDEELKDYYRKDKDYVDFIISKRETGRMWDCWYRGQCTLASADGIDLSKTYFDALTDSTVLGVLSEAFKSGEFTWLKASAAGSIDVANIYLTIKLGVKAYNSGINSFAFDFRSLITDLKPIFDAAKIDIYNPYAPWVALFSPDGIYESLKSEGNPSISFLMGLKDWTEDAVKAYIYDILQNIYDYNSVDYKQDIKNQIFMRAAQLGAYKEFDVSINSSIVEQNQIVIINGNYFSKKGIVEYAVYYNENIQESGEVEASLNGSIEIRIPTDCDTVVGDYVVEVIDIDSMKTTNLNYSVISALACDNTPPELLTSLPSNMQDNVSIDLNSICYTFDEEMIPVTTIKWEGIEEGDISTMGNWETPYNVCFSVNKTIPYNTSVFWTLNDPASADFLIDLAGNRLPMTGGYFTTELDPNDIDNDGDGFTENKGDCDDTPITGATIYPGAEEICDGRDNNCDGTTDEEGCETTFKIDFDELNIPHGGPFPENTYLNLGVKFYSDQGGSAFLWSGSGASVLDDPNGGTFSLPNAIMGSTQANVSVVATFIDPLTSQPASTSFVQVGVSSGPGTDTLSSNVALQAYDISGNLIAEDLGDTSLQFDWLSVNVPNIHKVVMVAGNFLDIFDDFTFESTVPIPIDLTDGLVAYYPLDGNAHDLSGNNNNGVEYGGLSYTAGVSGQAARFDGEDDFVEVSNSSSLNTDQITISAWIKPTDLSHVDQTNLSMVINKEDQYEFAVIGGPVQGYDQIGELGYSFHTVGSFWYWHGTDHIISLNQFSHVVISFDLNNIGKVFVNGVKVAEFDFVENLIKQDSCLRIGARGCIGWRNYEPVSFFKGLIDEVRIYNRTLSDTEIQDLYSQGGFDFGGRTTGSS